MPNDYTTTTDTLADIAEGSYSAEYEPLLSSMITVASRLIDREVGRWEGFFYPTTDTKTDYYDGSGCGEQEIGEYVSISAVSVSEQGGIASTDYTAWGSTDYVTYPYNASNHGKPIHKLLLPDYLAEKNAFYGGQKSIKVEGIPGYSSTPPALVAGACKIQAIRFFFRAKSGWQDTSGNDEIGKKEHKGMVELDADVRAMLWGFKLELDR